MRADIAHLAAYYSSAPGRAAADILNRHIRAWWPDLTAKHLAGIGYAVPLLERLGSETASQVALMPAQQGASVWHGSRGNASALIEEAAWALPNGAYDCLILLHALEVADDIFGLMDEVARCLNPGGRAILIVPRRRGVWSSSEATPFGFGRPFSTSQLRGLLEEHGLGITRRRCALVLPPMARLGLWRGAAAAEHLASRLTDDMGGLLMVEVDHRSPGGAKARAKISRRAQIMPVPVAAPSPRTYDT